MALAHADNFNIYGVGATGNANMLLGVYAQADGQPIADPDGVSTALCLNAHSGSGNNRLGFRYALPNGGESTVGVGLRWWQSALPSGDNYDRINILTVSNTVLGYLTVGSNGAMLVGLTGGTTYRAAVPSISAAGWYHIEFKYQDLGSNLISFEVRVEGVTVLSGVGVAGTSGLVGQIGSGSSMIGNTWGWYLKDLVIWTGSGTSNNNFLGSVLVTNLAITADVALNWTPTGAANGWSILDNIPPVDANYIAAPTPAPAAYQGVLSDLPANVTSVKGLVTYARAAKTDGGDGSLQVSVVSDPSGAPATANGANRPITVAQTYWRDIFEQDPKTGAAWLPGAVNAANIKLNRTA